MNIDTNDSDNPAFNKYDSIIIILITIFISLLFANFTSLLKFRWNYDYLKLNNLFCSQKGISELEIETSRYNLLRFFNNIKDTTSKYSQIYNEFNITYISLLIYFIILIIVLSYLIYYYQYNKISLLILIILFIIYISITSVIKKNFENIDKIIIDNSSDLNIYKSSYYILNAIMLISNIHLDTVDYSDNNLNMYDRTIDKVIENNIASIHNLSNATKINQIKLESYNNFDFVKYLTLDKLSRFYLKYFDDIYLRITGTYNEESYIDDKIYLKDIISKRINFEKIENNFKQISTIISLLLESDDNNIPKDIIRPIKDHIDNNYPIVINDNDIRDTHRTIIKFYCNIPFFSESTYEKYKFGTKINNLNNEKNILKKLKYLQNHEISKIILLLNEIEYMLDNSIYSKYYININNKIRKNISQYISVPNNDYVNFIFENQQKLFDITKYNQITQTFQLMKYHSDLLFAYIFLLILVSIIILHLIFKFINNQYMFITLLVSIIIIYTFIFSIIVKYI